MARRSLLAGGRRREGEVPPPEVPPEVAKCKRSKRLGEEPPPPLAVGDAWGVLDDRVGEWHSKLFVLSLLGGVPLLAGEAEPWCMIVKEVKGVPPGVGDMPAIGEAPDIAGGGGNAFPTDCTTPAW